MKMDSLQSEKGKLHREKVELEKQLEVEQEYIVNRLQKRVDSLALEKERLNQEKVMLKREVNDLKAERRKLNLDKVILESTLEQEEEAIVNKKPLILYNSQLVVLLSEDWCAACIYTKHMKLNCSCHPHSS